MTRFFLKPLSVSSLLIAFTLVGASAEDHPVWSPGLEQTATAGKFGNAKPPESVSALRRLVSRYILMTDTQLNDRIGSQRGGAHGAEAVRERAEATYNLALLYHLTGNRDYGRRSAILLRAYANAFPSWKYEVCEGKCGVWTPWYHADFFVSKNLALAYDLLAPSRVFDDLGPSVQELVRNLLVRIVQVDLEFSMYTMNWAFFRPVGLVIFGRVLDDPELVHLGYWFLSKIIHEYYTRDGFLAEGTYSYHTQITERILLPMQAYYLDGYTDPPAFVHVPLDHRWDPPRIENYDLDKVHGEALRRMAFSLRDTALPNGEWPILNETKHYGKTRARPAERSILLGGIGHAILARGKGGDQAQARLDFSFSVSHHHRDALNLIYFDDHTEVVGGTAYRKPDRAWNRSTLSHNLVVVNGMQQKGEYFVDWTKSPYVPGTPRTRLADRQRWDQEKENLHNNVLIWEPGYREFDAVQIAEAEATDAYRDIVDRYQRTLVMVDAGGGDQYLVDIFRVRGGVEYDWLLHGGHDRNSLSTNLVMKPASGRLGQIALEKASTTSDGWEASFSYENGVQGRVLMCGQPGTVVSAGSAPRYEYGGEQDHLVVHRSAEPDREEVFLAVHETHRGVPAVASIEELKFEGEGNSATGLRITLADGAVDYLVHTLDEGPDFPEYRVIGSEIRMSGRVAHIRTRGSRVEWMYLVQGGHLEVGKERLSTPSGDYSYRGLVRRVERREAGAKNNLFVVDRDLSDAGSLSGKSLHVTWGNGWTWVYRIERVVGNRILVSDEPGFDYDGGAIDSQYFPIQEFLGLESIPGPVSFSIPGTALRDQAGRVFETGRERDPAAAQAVGGEVEN